VPTWCWRAWRWASTIERCLAQVSIERRGPEGIPGFTPAGPRRCTSSPGGRRAGRLEPRSNPNRP
jgi:hypothetical protein